MQTKKVLGLIVARGGSKTLPRKNLLFAGGKPLIAWTILAALESKIFDEVIVSSDDDEIMETAKEWGCTVPFRRPDELASDTASSIDVVFHAIDNLPEFEHVALLQPTSPLRSASDIKSSFLLLKSTGAPSCVSVCEVDQTPYWMFQIDKRKRLRSLYKKFPTATCRQNLPPSYFLNGAIYIAKVDWLKQTKTFLTPETVAFIMEKKHSIDIDTREDFELFRSYVEN